ncbi:beta-carotene 15,15'-monooxygenase, partial [Lactobacillus johnsonii]
SRWTFLFFKSVQLNFTIGHLDYLLLAFGIISAGYLGFKTNAVFRKDLKNKKLKFGESIVAICLGLGSAIVLILLTPKDILWLFLLIFALAYNLIHLIVRIKVEHDGTNREL